MVNNERATVTLPRGWEQMLLRHFWSRILIMLVLLSGACSSGGAVPPDDGGLGTDAASPSIDASQTPIDADLPPDPATVAPPLDRSVPTTVYDSTRFLYTGEHPIQTGVDAATIEARRAAVLRGRVTRSDGAALPGASVTVLGHPELGQTLTRGDGVYDLVTNGGNAQVVVVRKDGFLEVQRTLDVPWREYVTAPDIVLVELDPTTTRISLAQPGMKIARGNTVTDTSGARRATLLFAPDTTATVATGTGTELLTTLSVHLTEVTTGPSGPLAMPGSLPPTSAYTYAVEVTVDEAHGRSVQLSQPAILYVENFLGFAPGTGMPVGAYDRDQGRWTGLLNGVVLKIVSIADGQAAIDADGDGVADSPPALARLGVTALEQQALATLYPSGQVLWRSLIPHFTPLDCNRPIHLPADARFPGLDGPRDESVDDGCHAGGSIIQCHNQSLGEDIAIIGTPYALHYQSDRQAGHLTDYSVDIQLSDGKIPESASGIRLVVQVAGRLFLQTFPPTPNQKTTFTWDGKDVYGRMTQGRQAANISVGYVFLPTYADPETLGEQFGQFPSISIDRETAPVPTREQVTIFQNFKTSLGPWDAVPVGLGGFTLDEHHTYDVAGKVLYLGTGETRRGSTLGQLKIDKAPIPRIPLSSGGTVQMSVVRPQPDGGFLVADSVNQLIYAVAADQSTHVVAGTPNSGAQACVYAGDGGPATQAKLCSPLEIVTAPDGTLYIVDGDARIRRVTADGNIHTVAGHDRMVSGCVPAGIGGAATEAQLCSPRGLVAAADGALYFADATSRIFKINPSGTLSVVAGTGSAGFAGDGGPAAAAVLSSPASLAIAPDGSIIFTDSGNLRIRRIAPDGRIDTIAGTGASGQSGDGGPAINATFQSLAELAVGRDGTIYVADPLGSRYRFVNPQGLIAGFAGSGVNGGGNLGGAPTDARFSRPSQVSVGQDGTVYLHETGLAIVLGVSSTLPTFSLAQLAIPSAEGGEIYIFDNTGRHLRTVDAYTNAIRFSFDYNTAGQLIGVTDVDGNKTRIERDPSGVATAIVAPFGQRTEIGLDATGYLSSIVDPAGGRHSFSYRAGGMLSSYIDPRAGVHSFSYDGLGRLTEDHDPGQGSKTLVRTGDSSDATVTMTTAAGRSMSYGVRHLATGEEIWANTLSDGTATRVTRKPDGSVTSEYPDGTTATQKQGPDPRFGLLAAMPSVLTLRTPGGLVQTQTTSRVVALRDPADPTSLLSEVETFTLNGKSFTRTYNAASKTVTVRSPLGRQTTATVNDRNRIASVLAPTQSPLAVAYDGFGRPLSVAQGARQQTLTYDAGGRIATASDALSHTVRYDRDALGRPTAEHRPDDGDIEYGFDDASAVLRVQPPGAAVHRFERDALGLARSYLAPDVGAATSRTTYDYNLDHQLTTITKPDGSTVTMSYDDVGRTKRLEFPGGSVDTSYDARGRISQLDTADHVGLNFDYDGSLPTAVTWTGAIAGSVQLTFDNDFRLASERVGSEAPVIAAYDDDGLLTGMGALQLVRDPTTGQVKQATVGGVSETYAYDALGELSSATATCGGTTLRTLGLTRDAAGAISGLDENVAGSPTSTTYDHDAMGRVSAVHVGSRSAAYTYDLNGNRRTAARPTVITDGYDDQDRLVRHGTTSYAYTADGQLQTKRDGTSTTRYGYDLIGNLRSIALPDGHELSYVIDGANRRIAKRLDGTLVQAFLYNGSSIVAELGPTGAVVSRFVYGTRANVPDYLVRGGVTYRILSDAVGSPRLIIDVATCQIAQQIDYDEFGRVLADSNPGLQPFGFAGGLFDRDAGLVRFGARDYDPEIGRWTAKDPLGFAGGDTNLYAYVANDPIDFIDPTGMGFWQGLTDFSAGFGDTISFGLTRWVRKKLGVNDVVNPCSGIYRLAGASGLVVGTIATLGFGSAGTAAAELATESSGQLFYRFGTGFETATRLERQAALAARTEIGILKVSGLRGVSVTQTLPQVAASSATREAIEAAGFTLVHTPTAADALHHTLLLPNPVTKDVADVFNALFGRI